MSLGMRNGTIIPEMTAEIARRTFPKGNKYMTLRDELGPLYSDSEFADLFSWKGEIAESPGLMAMVCVMQYMETLTDRQAAEAVRARIDWKYALGLALDDTGFDASVLSRFRQRLLDGGAEARVLDRLLQVCNEKGLLKKRGRQRSDSTHVLGAVRELNRLELVGETLRQALEVLAVAVPDWLRRQVTPEWFERYGRRMEQARFPKSKKEQTALRLTIGADGYQLLSALYADKEVAALRANPGIETLRQVWLQQYYQENGQVHWRQAGNLPPGALLINSPYDVEVRYSEKRQMHWKGYKVHTTETCDVDTPHLIVHVETTPAPVSDCEMVAPIHTALAQKGLLPQEHLMDAGYVDAENVVQSQQRHQVDVVGPVRADQSWQVREESGFDISCFFIDWESQTVTCPNGKTSRVWSESVDAAGTRSISVRFARADCRDCPTRSQCTRSAQGPRGLCMRTQAEHETLQQRRQAQQTPAFQERYQARAGVEGTLSQGIRRYDLRQSRYIGLAKTHLQHLFTAVAINLTRLADWFTAANNDVPIQARRATARTTRFAAMVPS